MAGILLDANYSTLCYGAYSLNGVFIMSKISCAEMGYDCIFSIEAEDGEQELILNTTEQHALTKHEELTDKQQLKPEVKQKLFSLLEQSQYRQQAVDKS